MPNTMTAEPIVAPTEFTICPACDLAQQIVPLDAGETLCCARCGEELACGAFKHYELVWALLITAVILIVVMNSFPLVEFKVNGITTMTTLIGAIYTLCLHDMPLLSALVLATTVVVPSVEIVLLGFIFTSPKVHRLALPGSTLIRLVHHLREWSMVEVFMLGIIVSLVKLAALAEIVLGPAIWACAALIVVLAVLKRYIRAEQLWLCYKEMYQ